MYVDNLYAAHCLKAVRLCEVETIFQSNHIISVTHANVEWGRPGQTWCSGGIVYWQTEGQREHHGESDASDDS